MSGSIILWMVVAVFLGWGGGQEHSIAPEVDAIHEGHWRTGRASMVWIHCGTESGSGKGALCFLCLYLELLFYESYLISLFSLVRR